MKFLNYFSPAFRIFVLVLLFLILTLFGLAANAQQKRASFGISITVVAPTKVQVTDSASTLTSTDRHSSLYDGMKTAPVEDTNTRPKPTTSIFSGPGFSASVPMAFVGPPLDNRVTQAEVQAQTTNFAQ
jgi:hypothetical protein